MPGPNVGLDVVRWVGMLKHKVAVTREASSRSRPRGTELGYSKTIYRPSSSELSEEGIATSEREPRAGGTESCHSVKFNGEKSRSPRIYYLVKLGILLAVSVIVILFQIEKRPFDSKFYTTNDPDETRRDGEDYTCGCYLPAAMQGPEYPSTNRSGHDICYVQSDVVSPEVVMFSVNAAQTMFGYIPEEGVVYVKRDEGYIVSQQAHDIHGPISGEDSSVDIPEMGRSLFRNGDSRQPDLEVKVEWLMSPAFMGFPPAYMRLAFIYRCNNCSSCPLDKINEIFRNVTKNEGRPWGSCFYYHSGPESGNRCSSASEHYYQAKCTLYPTSSLPAHFAVKGFLNSFKLQPFISNITVASPRGTPSTDEEMSFQPSTVFLNYSRFVRSSNNTYYYFELPSQSPWRAQLFNAFPELAYYNSNCSNIRKVDIYNTSSICNAFATPEALDSSYDLSCIHMYNTSIYSQCQDLMANSSVDNEDNLFNEVGKNFTGSGAQPKPSDYEDLACHKPSRNVSVPPYKVRWKISDKMKKDPLSRNLYSRILNQDWSQRSGVCFHSHSNIVSWRWRPGRRIFLQTNCTYSPPTDGTAAKGYCWLTGKYHHLADAPEDAWRDMTDRNMSMSSPNNATWHRFACYRVQRQNSVLWLFVQFGVIFGWIGTLDLLFKTVKWMRSRRKGIQEQF